MDPDLNASLLERVSDGIYFVTRDRRITYWNRGAEQITGYTATEVVGHSCAEGILRHVNDGGRQLCLHGCPLAGVMKDGVPRTAEVYLHHQDGHRVPVTVRSEAIRDETGVIVGAAEVFTSRRPVDRTRGERRQDAGSVDPVTGVSTRRIGQMHLESLLRASADGITSLGVLFLDADHFKSINDTFGHRVGDEVLRMVGMSLVNGLRADDVVVRWGGEEFVTLLPGVSPASLAVAAERIRMLVENSWIQQGDDQARVTVSIGATMATATDTADSVLDRADRLMYASKNAGRNRVTGDHGTLVSEAERPLLGTRAPWDIPGVVDVDGFGDGQPDRREDYATGDVPRGSR